MWRVSYATSSRADYGIVRRYLALLNNDDDIDLSILATGSLFADEYGHAIDLIHRDGFNIKACIDVLLEGNDNTAILKYMAVLLERFGSLFATDRPDMLIILGDRYEMLPVAISAAMNRIPILHLHGGEATYANYDEFIRHSITKMSHFHFTATEEYRRRVIQLGENPSCVWNLGSLGAENCLLDADDEADPIITSLPEKQYATVLFHPETLSELNQTDQINEVLRAVRAFPDITWVFIGPNADTGSNEIRNALLQHVNSTSNGMYFSNLTPSTYHHLLRCGLCLVGNSSSGIIEAPSLGIRTVNIGNRQAGRVRGDSVIDVACKAEEIIDAINCCIDNLDKPIGGNPYYLPNTACHYYETTKTILDIISQDSVGFKPFYDLGSHGNGLKKLR